MSGRLVVSSAPIRDVGDSSGSSITASALVVPALIFAVFGVTYARFARISEAPSNIAQDTPAIGKISDLRAQLDEVGLKDDFVVQCVAQLNAIPAEHMKKCIAFYEEQKLLKVGSVRNEPPYSREAVLKLEALNAKISAEAAEIAKQYLTAALCQQQNDENADIYTITQNIKHFSPPSYVNLVFQQNGWRFTNNFKLFNDFFTKITQDAKGQIRAAATNAAHVFFLEDARRLQTEQAKNVLLVLVTRQNYKFAFGTEQPYSKPEQQAILEKVSKLHENGALNTFLNSAKQTSGAGNNKAGGLFSGWLASMGKMPKITSLGAARFRAIFSQNLAAPEAETKQTMEQLAKQRASDFASYANAKNPNVFNNKHQTPIVVCVKEEAKMGAGDLRVFESLKASYKIITLSQLQSCDIPGATVSDLQRQLCEKTAARVALELAAGKAPAFFVLNGELAKQLAIWIWESMIASGSAPPAATCVAPPTNVEAAVRLSIGGASEAQTWIAEPQSQPPARPSALLGELAELLRMIIGKQSVLPWASSKLTKYQQAQTIPPQMSYAEFVAAECPQLNAAGWARTLMETGWECPGAARAIMQAPLRVGILHYVYYVAGSKDSPTASDEQMEGVSQIIEELEEELPQGQSPDIDQICALFAADCLTQSDADRAVGVLLLGAGFSSAADQQDFDRLRELAQSKFRGQNGRYTFK